MKLHVFFQKLNNFKYNLKKCYFLLSSGQNFQKGKKWLWGFLILSPSKSPIIHYILTDRFGLDFMVAAHLAFYSTLLISVYKDSD